MNTYIMPICEALMYHIDWMLVVLFDRSRKTQNFGHTKPTPPPAGLYNSSRKKGDLQKERRLLEAQLFGICAESSRDVAFKGGLLHEQLYLGYSYFCK